MTAGMVLSIFSWLFFALAFGIAGAKRCSYALWIASGCFGIAFVLRVLLALGVISNGEWGRFLIFLAAGVGVTFLLARLRTKNGIG